MLRIFPAQINEHKYQIRQLFWENFSSTNLLILREFNISINVSLTLEQEMTKIQQFTPPTGQLLLAEYEAQIVGCAGLRKISKDIGEVKRMYVRPEYRRKGIGRSLLQAILQEARQIDYSKLRLDSAPFAKEAQALYRQFGFQNIKPYAESEIPEKHHSNWYFMELVLKL